MELRCSPVGITKYEEAVRPLLDMKCKSMEEFKCSPPPVRLQHVTVVTTNLPPNRFHQIPFSEMSFIAPSTSHCLSEISTSSPMALTHPGKPNISLRSVHLQSKAANLDGRPCKCIFKTFGCHELTVSQATVRVPHTHHHQPIKLSIWRLNTIGSRAAPFSYSFSPHLATHQHPISVFGLTK